ncbi:sorting nexin-4-like [Hetaerina americana]|uniref:sorting nexin-4-like n=1 Tax=Hetaerina americana TaxID=62018 RepID=UPI003A7F14BE
METDDFCKIKSKFPESDGDKKVKDCLLDHMEISVSEAEKRATGTLNIRDFYTVYLIETKVTDSEWKGTLVNSCSLWRRYSEFELLRSDLEMSYPYIVMPTLPEKKVMYAWQKAATDTFDPDFVDRRRVGLESFLLRVASHPILSHDALFMSFLQKEDGWRETLKETGYLLFAESRFKAFSVSVRLKQPDKRFESIKNYGGELQSHMGELLRVRAKLASSLFNLHRLHANYGRVFSEWSAIEKEMGDGLQKAGHYLDSLALGVDSILEEEELIADQFKEYLFFGGALQNVCKRREALQLEVEQAEGLVSAKSQEKEKVQLGKVGLMCRLFGSVDTDEVRELKVSALDERIEEGRSSVKVARDRLNTFSGKALVDIERFQSQKAVDLRETLASYIVLQIKMSRKGLQTWIRICKCLESIP